MLISTQHFFFVSQIVSEWYFYLKTLTHFKWMNELRGCYRRSCTPLWTVGTVRPRVASQQATHMMCAVLNLSRTADVEQLRPKKIVHIRLKTGSAVHPAWRKFPSTTSVWLRFKCSSRHSMCVLGVLAFRISFFLSRRWLAYRPMCQTALYTVGTVQSVN